MQLSEVEIRFLIWAVLSMIAVFCFIGAIGVNALVKMAKDLTDIKISVKELATKHDAIEKRISRLENKVYDEK